MVKRMIQSRRNLLAALLLSGNCASFAFGQTVVNVPPDPAPFFVGSNTVLNLNDTGVLPSGFSAFDGSILNILGGTVGDGLSALTGSQINMSGGMIGRQFRVFDSAIFRYAGGVITDDFDSLAGSQIVIEGQCWPVEVSGICFK